MAAVEFRRRWRRYVPGDIADLDEVTAARLIKSGAAVASDGAVPEPVAEPEPVLEAEPTSDPTPAGPERPKNAGRLEDWQAYARARGVDPKGMTKPEIIASVG